MAWIESHQDLRYHPKLLKLCELSGWSRVEAIGRLHCLWWWVLEYRWRDGSLSDVDPRTVSDVMECNGENPAKVVQMLRESGFINDTFCIHDWMDFAGRIVKDRVRKQKERKELRSKKRPRTVHGLSTDCPGKSGATVPYPTVPRSKDKEGGEIPALSVFMAHFTKALKGKLKADPQPSTVKKAYGVAIGYLKTHQDQVEAVCQEVDFLQPGMTEGWYLASLRRIIGDRVHQELKTMTAGIGK